jgi:hypothetical protein
MYAADPRINFVPASQEQVVAIVASLNKPLIAVPGRAAQEVQAFVIGAGNNAGSYTLFVYLFLTESCEAVVYVDHERLRIEPGDYPQAEAEALAFVESMGFMLEALNWRQLTSEQQAQLMRSLPCFSSDLESSPGSRGRAESPQVRLARLFAAF